MVDHKSTSLVECGPTEYPALEPCYFYSIYILCDSDILFRLITKDIFFCKIYPQNRNIVYDLENLNVPPIYPCGICHKEVHDNEKAVNCLSGCWFRYHR